MCIHACSCSLSSDSLSDKVSAFFGTWSRDGSHDDLDPIWSHDLPTVTWSGTSGVTTSVCDTHEAREREVRQRLIAANALERVTRLMTQDGEYGELAWRHCRTLCREYSGAQVFRLSGGRASPVSWTSSNIQDNNLVQQDFDEQEMCTFCCWPDHIPSYCDTPHYKCSCDSAGYCRVPRHHHHFMNNMPNTCPYGGRR